MNEWLKKMKELIIKKSLKKTSFCWLTSHQRPFVSFGIRYLKDSPTSFFLFFFSLSLFSNLPFILYFTYMGIVSLETVSNMGDLFTRCITEIVKPNSMRNRLCCIAFHGETFCYNYRHFGQWVAEMS